MTRYCGRDFNTKELEIIRELIINNPGMNRAALSRLVCRELDWYKADGGLKDMSCRVAMLRMQEDGIIQLPSPKRKKPKTRIQFTPATDPQQLLDIPVHDLPALQLQKIVHQHDSRLWNEYIHRYHYLGYKPLPGAQLRYFVKSDNHLLALHGFGAAAWQTAPRDHFIGWSHDIRQKNLHLIVNHARFLILPWVRSKNLASKILSIIARTLPEDWFARYGYRPLLLETFTEIGRFEGTCYKAAGWINVGETKGRGKLGPAGKQSVPIKKVWLYPLNRRFRQGLTR